MWANGGTFISYVLIDKPVAATGTAIPLPFLVDRYVVITDIFAV
jgi:hypothetical protein